MRYGYLPPPDPSTGQLQAWTAVTHAVRAMQQFAGLKETGLVGENETVPCVVPQHICFFSTEHRDSPMMAFAIHKYDHLWVRSTMETLASITTWYSFDESMRAVAYPVFHPHGCVFSVWLLYYCYYSTICGQIVFQQMEMIRPPCGLLV